MFASKRSSLLLAVSATALFSACAVSPIPLSGDEMAATALDNASHVAANQEPISGPIGLYEAIARALKYNLDHHVAAVETALRVSELDLSHYNLLPNAVANSGYAARDKFSASSSLNLVTGVENFGASTSQEKKYSTDDITFSWSILDFGLSYIHARQAADKVLIAEEARRKASHRIVEDVRTAFWRTISAEKLMGKLKTLEARTAAALSSSRAISKGEETSPIAALTYQRELIEIRRTLQELQRDLSVAKSQLAALMNVPPGTHFALAIPSKRVRTPVLAMSAEDMLDQALQNRSELRENAYQQRINKQEANAALLELLPGLQLYAGSNFDSNDFLLNNQWLSWGTKASWNLLKVFSYPAKIQVLEGQDTLLHQRALALTMAIMTQVHISRARYTNYQKELGTAAEYADVQQQLVQNIRVEAASDRVSEQTLIREELNTLVAQVKQDIAFANCQNAYANVFASIGLDPYYDPNDMTLSVSQLAANLQQVWFERGDYPAAAKLASVAQ